jgi:hypothetical protein
MTARPKSPKPEVSPVALAAGMGANPLPTSPVPVPPKGFVPEPGRAALGFHPRLAELHGAPAVVGELRRFVGYDAAFGATVPPAERVAAILEFALQWRAQRDAAVAWAEYVRSQDARAWRAAFEVLDELKPAFELAATRRPDLIKAYPNLTEFFDVHKQIARRATATKKKKAQARAEEVAQPLAEGAAVEGAPMTER